MTNEIKLAILGVLILAIIIVIVLIVKNTQKSNIKRDMDALNVRFNDIKTIPLAFKLNKAQAMAKRNADTQDKVESYYDKYKEASKAIDEIGQTLEDIEDDFANKDYKNAAVLIKTVTENIGELEEEVKKIDEFLEQFSEKENKQRDISAKLKEQYREIKMKITENSNHFSIAYEGIEKKLEKCEELFSQSEEWMYANDYAKAQEILSEISNYMKELSECTISIPELIKDAKGVIPVLIDEAQRQNELARQRGIYLEHLNIEERIKTVQERVNNDIKILGEGNIINVKNSLDESKNELNDILKTLENENSDYTNSKSLHEQISDSLVTVKNLFNYVEGSYSQDNSRFDLEEVGKNIETFKDNINKYASDVINYANDLEDSIKPASEIKKELDDLLNRIEDDKVKLTDYKQLIDKNTNDEERAKTQLIKLQVVLNEVEVKVLEYHLPSIASNYKDDLQVGREKIKEIKRLLEEIPLNIENLNKTLDDAIDYIYTFYNNVNNIVGMAIMVENAIVFGNKYRSTHPTVDRDLSKAEFSYLNGEYTKALTMAISCMETLFPDNANERILENA